MEETEALLGLNNFWIILSKIVQVLLRLISFDLHVLVLLLRVFFPSGFVALISLCCGFDVGCFSLFRFLFFFNGLLSDSIFGGLFFVMIVGYSFFLALVWWFSSFDWFSCSLSLHHFGLLVKLGFLHGRFWFLLGIAFLDSWHCCSYSPYSNCVVGYSFWCSAVTVTSSMHLQGALSRFSSTYHPTFWKGFCRNTCSPRCLRICCWWLTSGLAVEFLVFQARWCYLY